MNTHVAAASAAVSYTFPSQPTWPGPTGFTTTRTDLSTRVLLLDPMPQALAG